MTLLKEEKDCGINCCHTTSIRQSNNSIADGDVESPLQVQQNVSLCENLIDSIDMNLPRSKEVDIEFQNIRYTIRRFSFAERKFVSKEILHGVNGNFRSGELTAIMGPSGSGKSSLLNVMTGFKSTGVTGTVQVNGIKQSTCSDSYRKLSCYIHQNDLLRPMLKVEETMMLAAHLKLGYKISNEFKRNLVKKILQLLGLDHRCNVYACKLSGGQKKRLAIALELISNPPVLYLDEPTTGLDSSSCVQCVSLLKKLAQHGHTIVCTIHQPSALIFELFDKLYGIVEGNCIYQGPVRELVPFLADQDLMCPSYHNPADYFMEVAVGDHDSDLTKLINAANKKYYEDSDLTQLNRVSRLITTIQENIEAKTSLISPLQPAFDYIKPDPMELSAPGPHPRENHELEILMETASFAMQYFLLLKRIVVCARRNYFLLIARIASHVIIGALFGYLYLNVGDKATTVLGNYVYLYGTILLLVYTGKMAVVLSFPLEIGMLSREHFNRWYGLAPYFLSTISFEIPFQGFCAYLYIAISYYLTGNDSGENFRFYYFVLLGVMATLSAQAWGFFIGAVLPIKIAVFIGPILAVLFSVFGFCTRYIDITPLFRWMWHLSYFRAAFHGSLNAVYGMDRELLICPDTTIYCHFKSPKVFLNYMMISDVNMSDCICLMAAVITTMHCLTVVALWHKLTKR